MERLSVADMFELALVLVAIRNTDEEVCTLLDRFEAGELEFSCSLDGSAITNGATLTEQSEASFDAREEPPSIQSTRRNRDKNGE